MDNKVLVTIAGREITEKDLEAIISRYPQEHILIQKWEEINY